MECRHRALELAGAPTQPQQIGITRERLRESFARAYHIRRRFTVLDVALDPVARVAHDVVDRGVEPSQGPQRLVAQAVAGGAAYELGMRERDHGIEIQPHPDG